MFGAIEAGGTKVVCACGRGPSQIRSLVQFPTTTPAETLDRAIRFLRTAAPEANLESVGVACFGPIDRSHDSPTYGYITSTPKPGWAWTDVLGPLSRALGVPIAFDTDTNAAALAEARWGAAQGLDTFAYITVGTGIGAGFYANGSLLHGLQHPEFGHIRIPHDWVSDPFSGCCPFHGECLEGLASGQAMAVRWNVRPEELPFPHAGWDLEARYLALGIANLILTVAPERVILGGGVMLQERLWPLLHSAVPEALGGYPPVPELTSDITSYLMPARLRERAGVLGALAMAEALIPGQ